MGDAAEVVHSHDRVQVHPDVLATLVQKSLYEILKSAPFRGSKQSQQLLQYIVDQSLAGHLERLKERIIGAEVFGRRVDYDTNEDPIVRARAAEVRKRLAQYYVGEGNASPIRIEISPGSYLATFSDAVKAHPKETGVLQPSAVAIPAQPDVIPHVQLAAAGTAADHSHAAPLHRNPRE